MDSKETNYTEDNIRTVTAWEHVRLRPEMYFERCFEEQTLDSFVFDSLCHAFDEHIDGICDQIELSIWRDRFSVRYDAGMPLAPRKDGSYFPIVIMTSIFACSNLKKHLSVGEEFCKIGISQINFGSESTALTTVSDKKKGIFHFRDGKSESIQIETFESDESWTEIQVVPCKELFGKLEITSNGVQTKIQEVKARMPNLTFQLINNIK